MNGPTRVVATNAGGALARLRVNQSYEQLSAGGIVSELASGAGVTPAHVADGIDFPFYVVDDSRSAWAHVAALARACGFVATVDAQGGLVFGPAQIDAGADVHLRRRRARAAGAPSRRRRSAKVTVVGEGAAGSQGADAWSWLVKDPAAVTATRRVRARRSGSLQDAVAAERERRADRGGRSLGGAQASPSRAALVVPGTPERRRRAARSSSRERRTLR